MMIQDTNGREQRVADHLPDLPDPSRSVLGRANAIAYVVSLLSYRTAGRIDLERIWNEQATSAALEATIRTWLPSVHKAFIETAGTRNVTEWCKREDCWRQMQTLPLTVARELERELAAGQALPTVGSLTKRSRPRRRRSRKQMQVPAEEWLHVVKWGAQSGHLKSWQMGIAGTLGSYAAAGWTNGPSAKQARQGVKILRIASEHGGRPQSGEE